MPPPPREVNIFVENIEKPAIACFLHEKKTLSAVKLPKGPVENFYAVEGLMPPGWDGAAGAFW